VFPSSPCCLRYSGRGAVDDDLLEDDDDSHDLTRALGGKVPNASGSSKALKADTGVASKLNRVYQLTGFSDPVYVESHLQVQDYDVVLDMLVVNQTSSTLQNLQVELHTSGDLKVVDRPQSYTIAPAGPNSTGVQRIHATIKLTSTESGVIFGNVVYDNASGTTKTIVVLNNIHMDCVDYINPATCSDVSFRAMWAEFEWSVYNTHRTCCTLSEPSPLRQQHPHPDRLRPCVFVCSGRIRSP
jgi:coatomer subunit beta